MQEQDARCKKSLENRNVGNHGSSNVMAKNEVIHYDVWFTC